MRLLLLDNRDSFVWNLAQAFGTLGCSVEVLRTDRVRIEDCERSRPDVVCLSPGPGRPESAGILLDAVRFFSGRCPLLGVCLGHQALGVAFGARLERSPPCHGKAWEVHHHGRGPFAGLPDPLQTCRYHSLHLPTDGLPGCFEPLAATPEGVLMAMRHREHPSMGLQFHPESFRSPDGPAVLAAFLEQTR